MSSRNTNMSTANATSTTETDHRGRGITIGLVVIALAVIVATAVLIALDWKQRSTPLLSLDGALATLTPSDTPHISRCEGQIIFVNNAGGNNGLLWFPSGEPAVVISEDFEPRDQSRLIVESYLYRPYDGGRIEGAVCRFLLKSNESKCIVYDRETNVISLGNVTEAPGNGFAWFQMGTRNPFNGLKGIVWLGEDIPVDITVDYLAGKRLLTNITASELLYCSETTDETRSCTVSSQVMRISGWCEPLV